MKKKIITYVKLFLGISIILILFYKIGFRIIIDSLSKTNLFFLAISFLFLVLSIVLNTVNLKMLFDTTKCKIPFWKLFIYFGLARTTSYFLPGRLGDFSLVYLVKKHNSPFGESTAIMILDKLISVFVFSVFAIIGAAIFLSLNVIWYIILLLVCLATIFLIILNPAIRNFIKRKILKSRASMFKGFSRFFFHIFKTHKFTLILNFFNTILRLLVLAISFHFLFLSLGVRVNLFYILIIESIITIMIMIPISVNGIGIKETLGVFLYNQTGVGMGIIAARYVLSMILNYSYSLMIIVLNKRGKN